MKSRTTKAAQYYSFCYFSAIRLKVAVIREGKDVLLGGGFEFNVFVNDNTKRRPRVYHSN